MPTLFPNGPRVSWRNLTLLCASALLAVTGITGAEAAPQCGLRASLLAELSERYGEAPIAIGLGANGSLLEVLAHSDGRTWSIMVTPPKGPSCLMASGEGWQVLRDDTFVLQRAPVPGHRNPNEPPIVLSGGGTGL